MVDIDSDRKRIRTLIAVRVVVALTLLLGSGIPLYIGSEFTKSVSLILFKFVFVIFAVSLVYSLLLNRIRRVLFFGCIQIIVDVILESVIVFYTGQTGSPFTILYIFTIIYAGIILRKHSCFIFAALCSSMYVWMVAGKMLNVLPLKETVFTHLNVTMPVSELVYFTIVNLIGFFTVAYFTDYISGKLEHTDKLLNQQISLVGDLQSLRSNILQSMANGLITLNGNGEIDLVNNAGERILGLREEQLQRKLIEEIFPDSTAEKIKNIIKNLSQSGELNEEFEYIKEGKNIPLGLAASPLKDARGRQVGALILLNDLTNKKELEKHKQAADRWAAVAELAANMAHEIRNPLAAISGSIEVLQESMKLDDTDTRLMDIILRESSRLNTLISDFLNYAKPPVLEKNQCDLIKLLKETSTLAESDTGRKNQLKIISDYRISSLYIPLDAKQIKQVFWNLIRNAMEAMPEGGILKISVTKEKYINSSDQPANSRDKFFVIGADAIENMEYACISFKDNGIGISEENLSSIFNPFTSFKENGSGLGLAISYRIIKDHGGRIAVKSIPNVGTVIDLFLPLEQTAEMLTAVTQEI